MNKNVSYSLALILTATLFTGCANSDNSMKPPQANEITVDEKEVIKKAISSRIEEIIQGAKNWM